MLASYNWLKSLLAGASGLTLSPKEVAAKFTGAGLEVESMKDYGAPAECIVAKVTGIRQHPTKSGLRLVTVDVGRGPDETEEIVCGAPNVPAPGGLVVLAPLGTHLPAKNMTIARRDIGGIASTGMLCSEAELGLSEDASGILILDSQNIGNSRSKSLPKPGDKFVDHFPRDVIFEIGLTPNRPDGLGHIGLARELAALCNISWKAPLTFEDDGKEPIDLLKLQIEIKDGARCPLYAAAAALNVTIAPSPAWARYRLESLGVRAISNVVDVTNLVMLETGHPMHAFDLDHVHHSRIEIRPAKQGESMTTLDGVKRTLTDDDLLICDGNGPVALAGVMGGADSEIKPTTTRVLFECAYFDPRGVRRTSRRHALHSESSHRFERGVDWDDHAYVLARALSLTTELAHGARALSGQLTIHGEKLTRKKITLRRARMNSLIGLEIAMSEAVSTLTRLGCVANHRSDETAEFTAPSHRPDLQREVDLIEEVMRVHGIDSVPAELAPVRATRDVGGREALFSRVRSAAVSLGLSEAVTFAFTSKESLEKIRAPKPTVLLQNPLSELQAAMRTSVLSGLVEALSHARRHGEKNARLFTLGSTYEARDRNLPAEIPRFAALLAGDAPAYLEKPRQVDVFDAVGLARELIALVTGKDKDAVEIRRDTSHAHLHPRGAASIYVQGTNIGRLGPLHPDVCDAFDLAQDVVVVELDVMPLAEKSLIRCVPLPRFPASARDLALVVPDDVAAGDVLSTLKKAAGELAEDAYLFDRFTSDAIPKDHSSLAFRVVYRGKERTLTDAEVEDVHARVVKEVNARFGATLRG